MHARDPQSGPPSARAMLTLAAIFYGATEVAALVWCLLDHRPQVVYDPRRISGAGLALGTLGGLLLALSVVGLTRWALAHLSSARELYRFFAATLGPLRPREAVVLALLSGFGEELLFRGAMQPTLGLPLTSLLFALLHFPPRLRFWSWTAMAGLLGLALGVLAQESGHLGGPILAHVLINALNLQQLPRFAAGAPPSDSTGAPPPC